MCWPGLARLSCNHHDNDEDDGIFANRASPDKRAYVIDPSRYVLLEQTADEITEIYYIRKLVNLAKRELGPVIQRLS